MYVCIILEIQTLQPPQHSLPTPWIRIWKGCRSFLDFSTTTPTMALKKQMVSASTTGFHYEVRAACALKRWRARIRLRRGKLFSWKFAAVISHVSESRLSRIRPVFAWISCVTTKAGRFRGRVCMQRHAPQRNTSSFTRETAKLSLIRWRQIAWFLLGKLIYWLMVEIYWSMDIISRNITSGWFSVFSKRNYRLVLAGDTSTYSYKFLMVPGDLCGERM